MSGMMITALATIACACAGVAGACVAEGRIEHARRMKRRARRLGVRAATPASGRGAGDAGGGVLDDDRVLAYAQRLTSRLFSGDTTPITPSVRRKAAGRTRAGGRYRDRAPKAGCSKSITTSAFCEAQTRLSAAGAVAGAFLGLGLSNELAFVLACCGAAIGHALPMRSVNAAVKRRTVQAERHLSEMLEVVALGLRSGLTFDRSFALYGAHFENELARSCTKAHRQWSLGLMTRDEALREFAESFECDQLERVVESVIRSLRFGSTLAETLEEAAVQARETYRTQLAERVAKAPVKMMLPTGTLILPSMLLLVMGPIVIELTSGF